MNKNSHWRYWLLRRIFRFSLRWLTRFEIIGLENFPQSGSVIVVTNHVHWLDPVVGMAVIPRLATVFAARKWSDAPLIGWILRGIRQTIFVARGEPDRQALRQALAVLKGGGVLGLSPEGTRSRTGGLQKPHNGVAYLASRTGAVIVPIALSGQDKVIPALERLHRQPVVARVGRPFYLDGLSRRARHGELAAGAEEIMQRLAALLPPEYRGVYR